MAKGVASEKGDLGDFAPRGETEKLAGAKGASADVSEEGLGVTGPDRYDDNSKMVRGGCDSAERALGEFAGIGKKKRSSGMPNDGVATTIPKEDAKQSLTNRKD